MALPKRKISKQRGNTRYANWKTSAPELVECPQCHEQKLAFRVCKACGYYDSSKVMDVDKAKKK